MRTDIALQVKDLRDARARIARARDTRRDASLHESRCAARLSTMLEDGTYDVFVVDANDDDEDANVVHVTLTVLSGPHKGEVLTLHARGLERESVELFGVPGTLVVRDGVPHLDLED
jgi:hypothetical protein